MSGSVGGRAAERFREALDELYGRLNRRELVSPDPLEFLYRCDDPDDREVVGLIAALLAYGNVRQIVRSVADALARLGDSAARSVDESSFSDLRLRFADFRHRFTTGEQMARLLNATACLRREHSSLEKAFAAHFSETDATVVPALTSFVEELRSRAGGNLDGFLPTPAKGSACKRLFLFLRWMVRRDEVDPGGWDALPPRALVVPLDTHMRRIALRLGFTQSKQSNLKVALEITEAFREICPEDPVRYDFVLTRFGIRKDMNDALLDELAAVVEETIHGDDS